MTWPAGYAERLVNLKLSGFSKEQRIPLYLAIAEFNDGTHEDILVTPDLILISIIIGNLNEDLDLAFKRWKTKLSNHLEAKGFGTIGIQDDWS